MARSIVVLACLAPTFLTGCGGDDGANPDTGTGVALSNEERLGKRLFEDVELSEPAGQSCASCHDSAQAFTGNHGSRIPAVAAGSRPEVFGSRNVPTAKYAMFSPPFGIVSEINDEGEVEHVPMGGQFWDGRVSSLAAQAKLPFLNPREMNNPDKATVVATIRGRDYADLFRAVYGANALDDVEVAYDRVGDAIAAFERTTQFAPFSSKFDEFLAGKTALTPIESHGFELFKDPEKGNCIACHTGDTNSRNPADWLFTDFTYDNLGVPRNPAIPDNQDEMFFDLGLCRQEGLAELVPEGFDTDSVCGAFKVPTLRNIERTSPYMHNGRFESLRDVVRFYVTRDTNPERWYPKGPNGEVKKFDDLPAEYHANVNTTEAPYDRKPGEQPRLDDGEIDAVVAFLQTLTDR